MSSRKILGAIGKITKKLGKSGQVAEFTVLIQAEDAHLIPLGGVLFTVEGTQKPLPFAAKEEEDDEK